MSGAPQQTPARRLAQRLATAGVAATVGLNIAYPLAGENGRRVLSVVTVPVFAAASVAGALATGGVRTAAGVLVAGGGTGLVAEVVGVATGFPFGDYAYAGTLGPQLAGVPLVVPLAWVMMTWPAWVVGTALAQRYGRGRPTAWVLGAWALASWDLFLDPQMVGAGHWSWRTGRGLAATLPGSPGIPVSNYLGWLGVSLVVTGVLALTSTPGTPPGAAAPGPATAAYLWTWGGGVVANALFFARPGVAALGGVAAGLVALPFARTVLARRFRGAA